MPGVRARWNTKSPTERGDKRRERNVMYVDVDGCFGRKARPGTSVLLRGDGQDCVVQYEVC